ncbi:hypothetical protein BDQ94DRAFT_177815 [Aspergillus welwitschiae]|uniref:Uncharacterized protein n=1 Tax=Aspergillus welwitschiae TaxID=1341132 RepID=A0A3F3PHK1_9EURO|nr:hypothetical protein BDQ94DRAFT_177815 [Aspergillus welwitschiae]RDH26435.1 hypothetical protein BDQ94DRAFT_177815 [Aspergillus welwitschiae]
MPHPVSTPRQRIQHILTSLPFPVQHRVLRLGQSNGWVCAEKVELHMAFRALERRSRIHSASKASIIPKGLNRLRADIEGIRHAAVHRQLQDHRRLLQQLHSARVFATVWLGDPQCGMEIEQCQMRINRLFSGWKARNRRLQDNLAARMGCNRMPKDRHHQFLLLEATRRLLENTNHDCVGQVGYILQASFPSLYTKTWAGHARHGI